MDVVAFVIGVVITAFGLVVSAQQRRREAWTIAKGTVTSGEVLEVGGFFTGVVRYGYSFDPASAYRGTGAQLDGRCESEPTVRRDDAERHLSRYPLGERVDVYVDPLRPARSRLLRTAESPIATWLVFAGFTVAATSAVVATVMRVVEP